MENISDGDNTWMNCALFLELNEYLKTDVTVERMCHNKGLAQPIFEYESKRQRVLQYLTSRI